MSAVPGERATSPFRTMNARLARRRAASCGARDRAGAVPRRAGLGVHHRGIVYILVKESVVFFQHVPIVEFLTDTQWTPLFDDAHYGIMVLLSGTLTSSAVALAVAIPLGTIIAIYLSEFAPFTAARGRQAVPRAARRRADHRLRLLRAAVRHAAAADDLSRAAGLQPAVGRHRHGHHDHSLRELDLRGRDARGADEPARRLLRDGRDALPDRASRWWSRRRSPASPRPTSSASRARWARP